MRRLAALTLLALAVPALAQGGGERRGPVAYADPADVLAAEIAFGHLVRDKGAAAAIHATATAGARYLTQTMDPESASVAGIPAERIASYFGDPWSPAAVWESCDGTYAVARSTARHAPVAASDHAYSDTIFTVWQRQRKGGYKWVYRAADWQLRPVAGQRAATPDDDFIDAKIAECPGHRPPRAMPAPRLTKDAPAPDYASGRSDDGTLEWETQINPHSGIGRDFTVRMRVDDALAPMAHGHRDAITVP